MDNKTPTQEDLKGKLNTITTIFYTVFVVWLIFLVIILFKLVAGEETTTLFIGTVPIVAILVILSQIKSKIKKEIRS